MKTKKKYRDSSRKWKEENKDRVKKMTDKWRKNNPEKVKIYRDNTRFNTNIQEVLEKYDFKCQECGMTQEQHIVIFGRRLNIHHIDGEGRGSDEPNNDVDNLIPLCQTCHARLHRKLQEEQTWGELLDRDDSEWKYPKLRELVQNEIKKGKGVQEAKRIVSENIGIGFSMVDHRYYEKVNREALCEYQNGRISE